MYRAEPWICEKILALNLKSPSMLAIFPLQDWLSMSGELRRQDPREELDKYSGPIRATIGVIGCTSLGALD